MLLIARDLFIMVGGQRDPTGVCVFESNEYPQQYVVHRNQGVAVHDKAVFVLGT